MPHGAGHCGAKIAFVISLTISASAGAQTVFYVNTNAAGADDGTSWTDAFLDLQDALSAAQPTDQIWVATGTYTPSARTDPKDPRSVTFHLMNRVALYGGFAGFENSLEQRDPEANETILSGDLSGDDGPDFENYDENCVHVVTSISTNERAVLDGFTIIGGYPGKGDWFTRLGTGLYNNAASPTVNNCLFTANAGALCNYDGSNPVVTDCKFVGNRGWTGAGISNLSSSPIVMNCVFTDNAAWYAGGGMWNYDHSNPTVTDCTFSGNSADYGGGMYNVDQSRPTVTRCTFIGNSVRVYGWSTGGAVDNESVGNSVLGPVVFTACLFVGNTAQTGGAMFCGNSSVTLNSCIFTGNAAYTDDQIGQCGALGASSWLPDTVVTLTNCTVAGNTADVWGGGVVGSGVNLTVTNCVLWGNSSGDGSGMKEQISGASSLDYSCIQGWSDGDGGTGNIGDDPLFVDDDGPDNIPGTQDDNLRLLPGSPAINTGDPVFVPELGETDLDGHARVLCERVDMGAYEFGIGDYDCDRIVDLTDFSHWIDCITGPHGEPYTDDCEPFDFDYDGDVDLRDLGGFQNAFAPTGP